MASCLKLDVGVKVRSGFGICPAQCLRAWPLGSTQLNSVSFAAVAIFHRMRLRPRELAEQRMGSQALQAAYSRVDVPVNSGPRESIALVPGADVHEEMTVLSVNQNEQPMEMRPASNPPLSAP